jgi:hypothetical protein
MLREGGLSSSSRCNKATIQKKKPHGKERTFFILVIRTSYHRSEETCDCSLFLLEPFSHFVNVGSRFLLRGAGCDTPSVTVATTVDRQYLYSVTLFEVWIQIQMQFEYYPNQVICHLYCNCTFLHTSEVI